MIVTTKVRNLDPELLYITVFPASRDTIIEGLIVSGSTSLQSNSVVVPVPEKIVVREQAVQWFSKEIDINGVRIPESENFKVFVENRGRNYKSMLTA